MKFTSLLSFSRHPIALLFHLLFRVAAFAVYIITKFVYGGEYLEIFIVIILLLAMDFWVVKNITGRLMVGLRWWNKVEDDGSSTWLFEAKKVCLERVKNVCTCRTWLGQVCLLKVQACQFSEFDSD